MKQEFTKEFMLNNCGCYSEKDLMNCSFMNSENILLKSILESEIPLKDKYWFLCRKVADKKQNQEISIMVAEIVLPIFEKKYPDDKIPFEAIQAAKQYISGHISLEILIEKRRAAADAAAYAAADAAATYAADAAAYAAADAAAYAAAYAADADIKQQLHNYLLTFITE